MANRVQSFCYAKAKERTMTQAMLPEFGANESGTVPQVDDKTLASWNGWMVRGIAEAARAFDRDECHSKGRPRPQQAPRANTISPTVDRKTGCGEFRRASILRQNRCGRRHVKVHFLVDR